MDAILTFLASPFGQMLVAWASGFLLKRWPAFFNKWIPLAQQVVNALIALIAVFAGAVPAHAGIFDALKPAGNTMLGLLLQSIASTLLANGVHTMVKNTAEGISGKK